MHTPCHRNICMCMTTYLYTKRIEYRWLDPVTDTAHAYTHTHILIRTWWWSSRVQRVHCLGAASPREAAAAPLSPCLALRRMLYSNHITTLPAGVFHNLTSLQYLWVGACGLYVYVHVHDVGQRMDHACASLSVCVCVWVAGGLHVSMGAKGREDVHVHVGRGEHAGSGMREWCELWTRRAHRAHTLKPI